MKIMKTKLYAFERRSWTCSVSRSSQTRLLALLRFAGVLAPHAAPLVFGLAIAFVAALMLGGGITAHAGSTPTVTVNGATTGGAGTKVTVSNSAATKLFAGNINRLS